MSTSLINNGAVAFQAINAKQRRDWVWTIDLLQWLLSTRVLQQLGLARMIK